MPSWLCFSGRQVVGKGGGKAIGLAIGAGATDHLDVWQGIAIDKQHVPCSLVFGCRSRCFCIIFRIMFIILYLGCTWALVILFHFGCNGEQVMEPRDFRGVAHCLGNPGRLRSWVQDLVYRLRCEYRDVKDYCTCKLLCLPFIGRWWWVQMHYQVSIARPSLLLSFHCVGRPTFAYRLCILCLRPLITLIFSWCCSVWLWPLLRGSDPQCFV